MRNVLAIILSLCVLNAFGQNADHTIERKGFVFGMGISAGVFSISDSDQEVAFDKAQGSLSLPNIKLGWMVNDRLAILGSFPGMIYELEGKDRSFSAFVPSVQYWFKDRWWVNGGIGLAYDGPALYEGLKGEDWNFGCAVTASTGFELVQKKRYALDIQTQLHLASTSLGNDGHREGVAFTVGIGFNWY